MAEETPTIDIDVKDIIDEPITEQPVTAESSPEENKAAEPAEEAPEEATDTEDEDDTEEEADTSDEGEVEDTEDDQQRFEKAEARKSELQTEIRALVAQKTQLRQDIETANSKVYRAQTPQELEEAGLEPVIARMEAFEQRAKMAEYNAKVSDIQAGMEQEALQVMHDFPVFDPKSPAYDEALANRVGGIYKQVAGAEVDPQTGLVYDIKVLPYNIYKEFAETHSSGAQNGQVNGQRAAEKMLANAETSSSSAPVKTEKEDPFLVGLTKGLKGF